MILKYYIKKNKTGDYQLIVKYLDNPPIVYCSHSKYLRIRALYLKVQQDPIAQIMIIDYCKFTLNGRTPYGPYR